MTPSVSIVMPVRNGGTLLRASLDSLYDQTFGDFELIVVDDGSTDGTLDLLHAERDCRLRVVRNEGRGLGAALNHGLRLASGEYVARQDADDESHPERLELQTDWLDSWPDVAVLATCADFVDADGRAVANGWTRRIREQQDAATTPEELRALLPLTCGIVHGSVMMRTAVVRSVGGYREDYVPAEDYDLWLRLLPHHRIAKLADRLYKYRVHAEQSSGARRSDQLDRVISAKLDYLRRTCAWLPRPARMIIADTTRGTQAYTEIGPRFDFNLVPPPLARPREPFEPRTSEPRTSEPQNLRTSEPVSCWDLFVVTDFASVAGHAARLGQAIASGLVVREGNLFVRAAAGGL